MTSPASPQPGNRDEHRSSAPVSGFEDEQEILHRRAAAAAAQPGAGGEADDGSGESKPPWAYGRVFPCTVTDELALPGGDSDATSTAPSAGQDTGGLCEHGGDNPIYCWGCNPPRPAPWRVGQHYGLHVYEGERPVATFHRPEDAARAVDAVNGAAPAGQDTERLREEIAAALRRRMDGELWVSAKDADDLADALLPSLTRLVAERNEARAQVQRVRDLSTELEREAARGAHPARREAADRLRRALGGTTGQPPEGTGT